MPITITGTSGRGEKLDEKYAQTSRIRKAYVQQAPEVVAWHGMKHMSLIQNTEGNIFVAMGNDEGQKEGMAGGGIFCTCARECESEWKRTCFETTPSR